MATLRRADREIQRDLLDELDRDPDVEVTDVGVEVDDGVVTLSGTVASEAIKAAARGAALRVAGVRAVADQTIVRAVRRGAPTDTDVAREVVDALARLAGVPTECIEVGVEEGGQVLLRGTLESAYQRDAVERAVRPITGVTSFVNLIQLSPPEASAEDVRTAIDQAFIRAAQREASRVQVEALAGVVRLSGTVRSAAQRHAAEAAAREVSGVSAVENELRVGGENAGAS
ncbi:MAG TPA: BON domain-containing protein [Thermomicrobiaceae bacterium]|nr:BON domain-containing protein [Thermomicrobiaceae bacterium]